MSLVSFIYFFFRVLAFLLGDTVACSFWLGSFRILHRAVELEVAAIFFSVAGVAGFLAFRDIKDDDFNYAFFLDSFSYLG